MALAGILSPINLILSNMVKFKSSMFFSATSLIIPDLSKDGISYERISMAILASSVGMCGVSNTSSMIGFATSGYF